MTTLITGASGFLGSAITRCLLAAGHDVRVLLRRTSHTDNVEGLPVERVMGDLTDRASLDRALAGCDALFHVAADYRLWTPQPSEIYESNVTGTRHIMNAAANAGVTRIVYTSSVATLGLHPGDAPADETTPVTLDAMIGHYKRSKFLAEAEVSELARQGLPVVIVNPSAPIGPRDIRPTPTGRMVRDAAAGRVPAYVDTGLNIVHVDDVAVGHLLAFEHGKLGERYILGGENRSLKDILTDIAAISGRPAPRVRLPHNLLLPVALVAETWARLTQRGEPLITLDGVRLAKKRMFFSSDKAHHELGYTARPAREALVDAIAWFRGQGKC